LPTSASTFYRYRQDTLDIGKNLTYNTIMPAVETSLEKILLDPEFLAVCRQFGWGTIEIVVKDGKPVMVRVKRDIKLS